MLVLGRGGYLLCARNPCTDRKMSNRVVMPAVSPTVGRRGPTVLPTVGREGPVGRGGPTPVVFARVGTHLPVRLRASGAIPIPFGSPAKRDNRLRAPVAREREAGMRWGWGPLSLGRGRGARPSLPSFPLSSELGTNKPVRTGIRTLLEPFLR